MKIAINERWYDITKFAKYHPGGRKILESFDGDDATEAFFSLHSDKAVSMLDKMKTVETKQSAPVPHPVDKAFQSVRQELRAEFKRDPYVELRWYIVVAVLGLAGTYLAGTHALAATILLGLCMQQAGWVSHELLHQQEGPWGNGWDHQVLQIMAGTICGFSPRWWAEKHNTHHVRTNHVGIDPDIHNQPILYLWAPVKHMDTHFRKFQHFYFLPLYFVLMVSWRLQSVSYAWQHAKYETMAYMALGYLWMWQLPLAVAVGSVLVSGFFIAIVVTVSHESEEIHVNKEESFVINQLTSTRDVECPDLFTEFFWGGMQYQVAHHLVPTAPSYHLPAIKARLMEFAREHNLEYKSTGMIKTFSDHYETLRRNAHVASHEGTDPGEKFAYVRLSGDAQ